MIKIFEGTETGISSPLSNVSLTLHEILIPSGLKSEKSVIWGISHRKNSPASLMDL